MQARERIAKAETIARMEAGAGAARVSDFLVGSM